ncbi:dihydrodipicolinate synthase family protein [Advenella kashmirensis]
MAVSNLDRSAKGVYPIAITPFDKDGSVDNESLDRLIDFYLSCNVPGLTILGVLGEVSRLSDSESIALTKRVLARVNGRAQVIVGVSHVGRQNFVAFTRSVMQAGAAGIMVAPTAGLKTEEQVIGFFDGLIGAIGADVPIALQDYPQNTNVFISPETLGILIQRHASIKVVKHEEASALNKITRLREQETEGGRERVSILVGNSALYLPQELHRGVDGANTGVAFPEMLVEVCDQFCKGQPQQGEDLYDLFLPLIRYEQQPGIGLAIRKEIFRRRGIIKHADVRAPGPRLNNHDHQELTALLARLQSRLAESPFSQLIRSHPSSS